MTFLPMSCSRRRHRRRRRRYRRRHCVINRLTNGAIGDVITITSMQNGVIL